MKHEVIHTKARRGMVKVTTHATLDARDLAELAVCTALRMGNKPTDIPGDVDEVVGIAANGLATFGLEVTDRTDADPDDVDALATFLIVVGGIAGGTR